MAEDDNVMSEQQIAERLASLVGTTPQPDEKQNVHTFLHNVATSDDTTKTGFLSTEELGVPHLPERTLKELALFCNEVANMDYYGDYLLKKAEILTSTSLSKDAKLISLAVLQKRQIEDVTKSQRKPSSSWFKKKEPAPPAE